MNVGILYRGHRKPYDIQVSAAAADSASLEREFEI
jgi:hypothetical protein